MAERWIQKAIPKSHRGRLHDDLGVPQGQTIPLSRIYAAAKGKGVVGRRARLALTLRKLRKR